VRQLKIFMLA